MKPLRLGIAGLGNMGATHARNLIAGRVSGIELVALADVDPARLSPFPELRHFPSAPEMVASGTIEAILIATPHFDHVPLGIQALEAGLHVLLEKPIAVQKGEAERLLAVARRRKRQVFSLVLNQRTDDYYKRIRALVRHGELGEIRRVNWIITNWFRPDAYYASSPWRATWAGEGGGVLLNQCPHNLDLLQWIFGMPKTVHAFCGFGRYHDVEVEDDVTAYLEFPNGATGVFITSTGEAPGTNRLEVMAERGRLVHENDRITFTRNEVPAGEFSRTTSEPFACPLTWEATIPVAGHGGQHIEIIQNFVDAIRRGTPLIAPGADGIHSIELANAMLLSAWTGRRVELPLRASLYARHLRQRMKTSRFHTQAKKRPARPPADLSGSFGH